MALPHPTFKLSSEDDAMATQKTYDVHYPVHHDKPKPYVKGEQIKLTEEEAAPLLHAKVISLPNTPPPAEPAAIDFAVLNKQQIIDTAKDKLALELDPKMSKEEMLAKVNEAQLKLRAS